MKRYCFRHEHDHGIRKKAAAGALVLAALVQACAPNPQPFVTLNPNGLIQNNVAQNLAFANAAQSAKVTFYFSDYYSLVAPNVQGCAGDAKNYYDPFTLVTPTAGVTSVTGPLIFPQSVTDTTQTVRPAFIKNISTDLTDANSSLPTNNAFSCSFGNPQLSPPSNCATFDFGSVGGIPTGLGGTLFIFGGIQNTNWAGITPTPKLFPVNGASDLGLTVSCGPTVPSSFIVGPTGISRCDAATYALGIDVLPPTVATTGPSSLAPGLTGATGAISQWQTLVAVTGTAMPNGGAGSAVAYSNDLQQLLLFGGSAPLSAFNPLGPGADNFDTWAFNVQTHTWSQRNSQAYASNAVIIQKDLSFLTSTNGPSLLTKTSGARAVFGYTTMRDVSYKSFAGGDIDPTERIIISGGFTTLDQSTMTSKFNPTFGPEIVDASVINGVPAPAGSPMRYLDSYDTQYLNNLTPSGLYKPAFASGQNTFTTTSTVTGLTAASVTVTIGQPFIVGAGTFTVSARPYTYTSYNPGTGVFAGVAPDPTIAPAVLVGNTVSQIIHGAVASNQGFSTITVAGAGFPIAAGGFDVTVPKIGVGAPGTRLSGGQLQYLNRSDNNSISSANFSYVTNLPDGTVTTPGSWLSLAETPVGASTVPWYGGVNLVQGFHLANNDLVYFGGSTCRDYLIDTNLGAECDFANPGRYWILGTANPTSTLPADTGFTGTSPALAGMAAARGLDTAPLPNVIIVGYGGMSGGGKTSLTNDLYFLSNLALGGGPIPIPTWNKCTFPAGKPAPTNVGNAAMVFSHVTRKFYLFGGYSPSATTQTSADTWELTVTGNCTAGVNADCTSSAGGKCSFSWRQLNTAGSNLTCYPTCPSARRSHRMVEVNYNAPTTAITKDVFVDNPTGVCQPDNPCSFGIFMEGGTGDGLNLLGERWMFDPTANGGIGHWQRVDNFPPRTLAAMTEVDYPSYGADHNIHRTVMFGGETGMHSPPIAAPGLMGATYFFVPPTLGDTFMYDLDSSSWNRMQLYGVGYKGTNNTPQICDPIQQRQAYDATLSRLELSPPPISGGMMITRTQKRAPGTGLLTPLRVPEVYFVGGRLKDGTYHPLSDVWKMCPGSTGETPQLAPVAAPGVFPTCDGSTQIASVDCDGYDPVLNPLSISPVTDYVGRWIQKMPTGAPPTAAAFMGGAVYDTNNDKLVVFGGLSPSVTTDGVTRARDRMAVNDVYEYTFPTDPAAPNGTWNRMPPCNIDQVPVGRYGHNMGYDPLNQRIVIVGGFDSLGNSLLESEIRPGGFSNAAYSVPEVWVGARNTNGNCYDWRQITVFGNSPDVQSQAPPITGLAHAASVFIPASGYNTGYYSMFESSCTGAGPVINDSRLAGGAYIDIDRTVLDPNENLLLNLTYIPLGTSNQRPDGKNFTKAESAMLRIHLVRTQQALGDLVSLQQPRYNTYFDQNRFPEIAQSLDVISEPNGQIKQDQILLPISIDPSIDRIRIERYSGSAILIDATLFRMGSP